MLFLPLINNTVQIFKLLVVILTIIGVPLLQFLFYLPLVICFSTLLSLYSTVFWFYTLYSSVLVSHCFHIQFCFSFMR